MTSQKTAAEETSLNSALVGLNSALVRLNSTPVSVNSAQVSLNITELKAVRSQKLCLHRIPHC